MLAIAIDMGGTKIEGSVVDERVKVLKTMRVATEAKLGRKRVLQNMENLIVELLEKQEDALGVGISMPGFVDANGKVIFAGAIKCLENFELKKHLERKFGLPVLIENDANCFALAEATYGAGKNHRVVVGVIWGTGIGGGIVIDRKVFSGSFGAAGEFGHSVIDPAIRSGKRCGCGQYGCLNVLASGSRMSAIYKSNGGKIENANPRQIYDSKEVVAKKIINDAIQYLGLGIAGIVNMLNPDIVVIGGGVSNLPDQVYDSIEKVVRKYAMNDLTKKLKIVRHKISDTAGILGAAALVFENKK